MAARLIADLQYMRAAFGEAFIAQLTYLGIFRGAPHSAAPVLVESEGRRTVIINDPDAEAARALPADVATIRYGRYFTWDMDSVEPALDFADAVRRAANGKTLICDAYLPQSRYEALAATGPISLEGRSAIPKVHVYRKSLAEIEAQWATTRASDCAPLQPYLAGFPHARALTEALERPSEGFPWLEKLCRRSGLDALYVTSPYEVELFTGLPDAMAEAHGITAIYVAGEDHATICAAKPIARADFVPDGGARVLSRLLGEVGKVGAQKNEMPAALWQPLAAAGVALIEGDTVLRRWQDCRAGTDFGYFVFAANAVIEGFAAAETFFDRAKGAHLTERDLAAAYRDGVNRFRERIGFKGHYSPYFEIVHSGARTPLPATAADYPVSHEDLTIAFDMGIVVRDSAGCARAVSDIARTICATQRLADARDQLRRALIDGLIPRIRPGLTGEQIHAIGVDCLRPLEPMLRAAGLLPEGKGVTDYRRDCGHAIHRQTVSSIYFVPGNRETIEEGMLGCVEYVWPVGDILIGVEEGYLVTREATLPFTREPAE
jgi:Xaa-Pro aminopeptidase